MTRVRPGVLEIDTRMVGVQAEQNVLQVPPLVGERLERFSIGNGHGAVDEIDGGGGVDRILAQRVGQFREVVDAIAVDVGRVGGCVLLHPVAFPGQCSDILGQRGRAGLPQLHQDGNLHLRTIYIVLHIEHEVVVGRGGHHDRHRRHRHRHRCRGSAAAWTRIFRVVALRLCRRRHDHQQCSEHCRQPRRHVARPHGYPAGKACLKGKDGRPRRHHRDPVLAQSGGTPGRPGDGKIDRYSRIRRLSRRSCPFAKHG